MFYNFTSAAILALTVTAAQASDTAELSARIRASAEKACAVEHFEGTPYLYHDAIFQSCISRVARATKVRLEAAARAKTSVRGRIADN